MANSSTYEKYFYIQIYMYFMACFYLKFSAAIYFEYGLGREVFPSLISAPQLAS